MSSRYPGYDKCIAMETFEMGRMDVRVEVGGGSCTDAASLIAVAGP